MLDRPADRLDELARLLRPDPSEPPFSPAVRPGDGAVLPLPARTPGRPAAPPVPATRPVERPARRGLAPGAVLWIALESLNRTKTRSFLAILGIIIGVASVITMMGLGEGTRLAVEEQIRRLGSNLLTVRSRQLRQGAVGLGRDAGRSLTLDDAAALLKKCPAVARTSPRVGGSAQIKYRNRNNRTDVMGVGPDWFTIRNFPLASGRGFRAAEIRHRARVCVIGSRVAEDLFRPSSPLGKRLQVKGQPFEVIGVLTPRGGSDGDWDERVWIPVTTAMDRVLGLDRIDRIEVQARDEESLVPAQEQIETLLRKRHRLQDGDQPDFEIRNQADLLETAHETSDSTTALLAGIAAVSLLVGGIGIMNIMLVSVAERTREIGIRRAVGARRGDILAQFLVESLVMCGAGALLGVAGGLASCWVGANYAAWPISITPDSLALSCGCAVGIGLFFGLYPAYRASGLSVLEALRHNR